MEKRSREEERKRREEADRRAAEERRRREESEKSRAAPVSPRGAPPPSSPRTGIKCKTCGVEMLPGQSYIKKKVQIILVENNDLLLNICI